MELVHMSSGLSCVFHRSFPVRASIARIAQESCVWKLESSGVGRLGAVLTLVPKKSVLVPGSYEGVDQTLLVAGPCSKVYWPQESSTTTGGSYFSGFGPTSCFQAMLPVAGSSATRKPRPVLPA